MTRLKSFAGSLIQAALAPHAVDRYLELVDPMVTWTEVRGKVTSVRRRTDRTVTFTVAPTRQFAGFDAGQFVQVGVVIDGVRQTRSFSPANAANGSDELEFTVTAHDGGVVSRRLRDQLAVGDVLNLSQAAGVFTLPAERPRDIRLISAGSGITPVLSMLRTLVAEGYSGSVELLHYCRDAGDNPYTGELAVLAERDGVTVNLVHTRGEGGHFTAAHLPRLGEMGFVCGPPALLGAVSQLYSEAEVPLRFEEFTPPAFGTDGEQAEGILRFTESAATADNDGRPILDQAESAGLFPESGCRMGICFSCTAVRESGCTKNLLSGELETEPGQHIQLCVSAPVGDVEIAI